MKNKVFVAISGGVDSAVAAALLKKDGWDVTGVFMKNWSDLEYGIREQCPWEKDLEDTLKICKELNIPHKTYNFEKEYREYILENFFNEYEVGNTPNPDVLCNKYIKFDKFLEKAKEDGADYIATGHYSITKNGKLYKAKDSNKDQTYFLYRLSKEQLENCIFPLGNLTKDEVRNIARDSSLSVAEKKDSQGLCFIGKVDIQDFLKSRLPEKEGEIIDIQKNKAVGKHNGVWFYTLGQRHGICIGGTKEPYFVAEKDIENNILYVIEGKKNKHLWKNTIVLKDLHLIDKNTDLNKCNLTATIRYRSPDTQVHFQKKNKEYVFKFKEKQWAPAPGQSLVVFHKNECLGGGLIAKAN